MAQQREYVFCPSCNDPVPGPFPLPGEFIQCSRCQETFPFDAETAQTAMLEYDQRESRWRVVPVQRPMHIQAARILALCSQASPGSIAQITPIAEDAFRVRVTDAERKVLLDDMGFYTHQLAAQSDDELWELLEILSNYRINRPA